MENPIGTAPHSYPWLMAAHLAAGIAADQPNVRTCFSLSPSKTFSIDIETCYPVDTVPNSSIDEYKE